MGERHGPRCGAEPVQWSVSNTPTPSRARAVWCVLWLTTTALLGCTSDASPRPGLTPVPTLRPVPSRAPTETAVPAHATANALLLTAGVLENRRELPSAIALAQTALVVATSQPADATRAANFLTRAPLRAGPTLSPTRLPPILGATPTPRG
jgi:hypothetical protein